VEIDVLVIRNIIDFPVIDAVHDVSGNPVLDPRILQEFDDLKEALSDVVDFDFHWSRIV
jgi:hypothetical protein